MAALQADNDGFLTGAPIKVDTAAVEKLVSVMAAVRGDTAAIRKALLNGAVASPSRSGNVNSRAGIKVSAPSSPVYAGAQRDSRGRFVSKNSSPNSVTGSPEALQKQQVAVVSATTKLAKAIERERNGKFKKKDGGSDDSPESVPKKAGFWARAKNSFSNSSVNASGLADSAAQVDPAAAAAGEVASALAPVARMGGGLFKFFRGDKEEKAEEKVAKKFHVPWYKKILKASQDEAGIASASSDGGDSGNGISGMMARIGGLMLPALAVAGAALMGTSIGTWINDKFGAQIATAIDSTVQFSKDSWDTVSKKWDEIAGGWTLLTDDIGKKWDEITGAIGEKFGIVKKAVVDAYHSTVDAASRGGEAVVNKASSAYHGAVDATSRGIERGANAAASAKDWVLGKTSQMFESGKGGAGTVSTGKGDHGGASYGTYQLSSKQGTLQKFLKSTKYGDQFAGLEPGSKEFNAKWKDIAKNDPTFGNAQHDYIRDTHYQPQMDKLANSGIDLSKRGSAVQDAVWSTSVQFGGDTGLVKKALAGKDTSKMKDEEITAAIQDYKIANNDSLFKSSSPAVRASTLNRAITEKSSLAALSSAPTVSTSTTSAAPSASVQAIPAAPPMPIASTANKGNDKAVPVSIGDNIFGQNLNDRAAAQLVTGGMGAYMGGRG